MNHADCYKPFEQPLAYICCGGSAKVAIVDLAAARHIGDIFCGEDSDPFYIAISPDRCTAYVVSYAQQTLLMLDLVCNQLVGQVGLIGAPRGIDISPCGGAVYVVFSDKPVMQILGADFQDLGQVALPAPGESVNVINHGALAYVTHPTLNQTSVIDLCSRSVINLLDTGITPGRMAYSPENALMLVAGRVSQTLTPVNTCLNCAGENIQLGGSPAGLAFTEGSHQCLVALRMGDTQDEADQVAAVDICSRQITARIPVGQLVADVAASQVYPLAVVSSQLASTVAIINTRTLTVTATLNVGNDPVGVAAVTC